MNINFIEQVFIMNPGCKFDMQWFSIMKQYQTFVCLPPPSQYIKIYRCHKWKHFFFQFAVSFKEIVYKDVFDLPGYQSLIVEID